MKNILGLLAIAFLSLNAYANIPRKMKCSEKPRNGYESARITFHAL